MTLRQLKSWLDDQLKLAVTLDPANPSDLDDPQGIAIAASKHVGRKGYGSGDLLTKAGRVQTPFECASVLIDCLAALPGDGPADPDTLTPDDVARMLGVSSDTVLGWINDHELKASNIASRSSNRSRWIITRVELDAFLRNRQPEPVAASPRRSSSNGNGSIQFY